MNVVVIGEPSLIGSNIVVKPNAHGHDVKSAGFPGPDAWLASTTRDAWATANGSCPCAG